MTTPNTNPAAPTPSTLDEPNPPPALHLSALDRNQAAEWLDLPQDRVISVEHPCIVKNIDNGLKSLGGPNHVKHLLNPPGQTLSVGLSLRPNDPIAQKIVSREVPVQNVLVRVSMPKRTGRRRKRGSDEAFAFPDDHNHEPQAQQFAPRPLTAPQLLARVRDNVGKYTVQPVGHIKETHRFRALPDFQVKTGTQSVMKEIGQHLLIPTLSSVKRFDLDTTPGSNPAEEIIPPPKFTTFEQSMNYGYKQNPGVSVITDKQGQVTTINLQKPRKRAVLAVAADIECVPQARPPDLPPLDSTNAYLKQAVKNIAALMEIRPVVTRRVAMNLIDWGSESLFKEATQYVGYSFRSGPWRDALVKYGIDPRTDPKYRVYQTLSFQLMSKDRLLAAAKKMPDGKNTWIRSERYKKDELPSHVFDGKGITTNGKTWQICDITESLISGLLETRNLRQDCDVDGWGWYHNGTMSKARILMRDMIGMMLLGQPPDYDSYTKLATMPDIIDPATYSGCYFDREKDGEKCMQLSSEIRNIAKSGLTLKSKIRTTVGATAASDNAIGEVGHDGRSSIVGDVDAHATTGHADDENDDDAMVEIEGDDLNASDAEEGADADEEEEAEDDKMEDGDEDDENGDEDEDENEVDNEDD